MMRTGFAVALKPHALRNCVPRSSCSCCAHTQLLLLCPDPVALVVPSILLCLVTHQG